MREYREFSAPAVLRPLVACTWRATVGAAEPAHEQRVVPDGCMDLVWTGTELFVAGPDTRAFIATQTPGSTTTGLRLRPGVAPGLLGAPAWAVRNRRVPLAELNPAMARRAVELLDSGHPARLALSAATLSAAAVGAAGHRAQHAVGTAGGRQPALERAAHLLGAGAGVAATADALGWTTRTLHRRAQHAFGYGPATLRRVLRFRAALRLARRGVPAAEVAAGTGYADQAHLAREVRALAGVPLGQLLTDTSSGANRSTA